MVSRFSKAFSAIFNGCCGTVTDAGHTVGAAVSPDGVAVLQCDIVGGTAQGALAAADAGIRNSKGVCLNKAGIENGVYRSAHEAVIEVAAGWRKDAVSFDGGNDAVNAWLGSFYDLPGLVCLWDLEHGDIVFRHDDLCRPHVLDAFRLTEFTVILGRIADFTAAGHD